MLESWRANCDVAIIVYDADPSEFSARDVATISGYVVSYTCKGGVSYQSEQESVAALIDATDMEFAEDDTGEALRLTRKIFNALSSSRVISKSEATLELLELCLYWCTESFNHVRLSNVQKLQEKNNNVGTL